MNPAFNSKLAYREALLVMPGGVNSPVRAFKGISEYPLFISRGQGSRIFDIDDNEFTDYCLSWGVCIHGHAPKDLIKAAHTAIEKGSTFGAPTLSETRLAQLITGMFPSIEKIRLVNSGTEAVMSAVRLARAYTERPLILKFDGCYHGHSDGLLISAGSGVSGIFNSGSKGITENIMKDTLSIPFNNVDALQQVFEQQGGRIAAVIAEPVPANMGLILPEPGYLKLLRQITKQYGSLLIFDEVITGFRIAGGGAQEYFDVTPDLTTLGKIIGGGFPLAAYGGTAAIMDLIAPAGDVYQAGTLSGNPVAVASGIAALELLQQPDFYKEYLEKAQSFEKELLHLQEHFPVTVNSLNGMFSLFFSQTVPKNYMDVKQSDQTKFPDYYNNLISGGIYLSPGYFETSFISTAHSQSDFDNTIDALVHSLKHIYRKVHPQPPPAVLGVDQGRQR